MIQVIFYLRSCLLHNADVHPDPDMPFDLGDQAPKVSKHVQKLLEQSGKEADSPILLYIELMQQLLSAVGGQPVMYCLLEVVAAAAEKLAGKLVSKLPWIQVGLILQQL